MNKSYTGLSFPLRLNSKGGLKMSSTTPTNFRHIDESINQILRTSVGERVIENYFGSSVSYHIFDPTDDSSYSLIKHEIVEALTKDTNNITYTSREKLCLDISRQFS